MGQPDSWWYSENGSRRSEGPAVPPGWDLGRAEPYRAVRRDDPQQAPQARQPAPRPPVPPAAKRENHLVTVLIAVPVLAAGLGFAYWNHARLSTPRSVPAAATSPASPAAAATGFPPTTPAAFRSFAATGDAGQVHEVASEGEGLPSCPQTARYVTVSPAVTGRALEADLSAYFVQEGLLGNQCGAVVFAYRSMSDYEANKGNGYTAGRVILSGDGGSDPYSLEVDSGSATDTQDEFDFNY